MEKKGIIEKLKHFAPTIKEDCVEIRVPVCMRMYDAFLVLQMTPLEEGYQISDDGHTFDELNHDFSYYIQLFLQNDHNDYYDFQFTKEKIYKGYPEHFSIYMALDQFVRFFISLDNFIMNQNIT